jgi:retron-type reverse transcriptase
MREFFLFGCAASDAAREIEICRALAGTPFVAGFEQRQDELLERLHKQLREKTYRPAPVKRVAIPKLGGGTRNLGIPSVRDRVVQQALVQKMNPIFEPLFADCSFGYRPGRSPHMAMRKVWQEIQEGNFWILDADLRAYLEGTA